MKSWIKFSTLFMALLLLASFKSTPDRRMNFSLRSPEKTYSDTLNIAAYKGKVVVINFWASWSKASRAENKNVVRVYEKYRQISKLVFISVSLDTDEAAWKAAIEEDEMNWPNHICDFKKYNSPIAKQYGVTTLPKLILIGKDGKIANSAAKMSEVEAQIDQLLK